MVPGSISLFTGIACVILLISGWGEQLCKELKLSRFILILLLLVFILGDSLSIPGPFKIQISCSGFLLPLTLCMGMIYLSETWLRKALILVKGCVIAVATTVFVIWMGNGLEIITWKMIWSSECLLVFMVLILAKTWQEKFTLVWYATLLLQIGIDIWVRHVPFEYFKLGNKIEEDMFFIGSIELCMFWTCLLILYRLPFIQTLKTTYKASVKSNKS